MGKTVDYRQTSDGSLSVDQWVEPELYFKKAICVTQPECATVTKIQCARLQQQDCLSVRVGQPDAFIGRLV